MTISTILISLPGTERRRRNNVSQVHDHGTQHKADQQNFGIGIRDLPAALMLLLKNPPFICQCLISGSEGFMISGLSTFLPKFIANQFSQQPSWAAILTGKYAHVTISSKYTHVTVSSKYAHVSKVEQISSKVEQSN